MCQVPNPKEKMTSYLWLSLAKNFLEDFHLGNYQTLLNPITDWADLW